MQSSDDYAEVSSKCDQTLNDASKPVVYIFVSRSEKFATDRPGKRAERSIKSEVQRQISLEQDGICL